MRFSEFSSKDHPINEGNKSDAKRYSSEVGMLAGFIGVEPGTFDPNQPEKTLKAKYLKDPETVYRDIKKLLAPNFDSIAFDQWIELGKRYQPIMAAKMNETGSTATAYGWAGGSNKSDIGPVDVEFVGSNITGVSIKAEGGITLSNLTPTSVGLSAERTNDIFYLYAMKEFVDMKQNIFREVMAEAKRMPGQPLSRGKPSRSITYNPETDTYVCVNDSRFEGTEQQILAAAPKNANWQRVFGDWFQANWATKKQLSVPLFSKIARVFEATIEKALKSNSQLTKVLRFEKNPYFYATAQNLYFVPDVSTVSDLTLKGIRYANPDGTGQRFVIQVSRPDSKKSAELDVYIRYANGMFAANPTVRVQSLKNPEYIGWEKLT